MFEFLGGLELSFFQLSLGGMICHFRLFRGKRQFLGSHLTPDFLGMRAGLERIENGVS